MKHFIRIVEERSNCYYLSKKNLAFFHQTVDGCITDGFSFYEVDGLHSIDVRMPYDAVGVHKVVPSLHIINFDKCLDRTNNQRCPVWNDVLPSTSNRNRCLKSRFLFSNQDKYFENILPHFDWQDKMTWTDLDELTNTYDCSCKFRSCQKIGFTAHDSKNQR